MQASNKESDKNPPNSRTGWAPILVSMKGVFHVMVLWRTHRGVVKIYARDRGRDSILGKVKKCEFYDGSFNFTDDLGLTARLSEKLLDMSIIGGANKLAVHIMMLRSKGELAGIAELLTILGTDVLLQPSRDFIKVQGKFNFI